VLKYINYSIFLLKKPRLLNKHDGVKGKIKWQVKRESKMRRDGG
jgi:hypothetical protein